MRVVDAATGKKTRQMETIGMCVCVFVCVFVCVHLDVRACRDNHTSACACTFTGPSFIITDERGVFDALGIAYLPPEKRINYENVYSQLDAIRIKELHEQNKAIDPSQWSLSNSSSSSSSSSV
jgi:hypothetical protein